MLRFIVFLLLLLGKLQAQLYIFISHSMPFKAVCELAQEAKKAKGALVMRGWVNQSLPETLRYVKKLVEQTQCGVLIHPELFSKYQVQYVPSMVLAEEKRFDQMTGHVSLKYALRSFKQEGDLKNLAERHLEWLS